MRDIGDDRVSTSAAWEASTGVAAMASVCHRSARAVWPESLSILLNFVEMYSCLMVLAALNC